MDVHLIIVDDHVYSRLLTVELDLFTRRSRRDMILYGVFIMRLLQRYIKFLVINLQIDIAIKHIGYHKDL